MKNSFLTPKRKRKKEKKSSRAFLVRGGVSCFFLLLLLLRWSHYSNKLKGVVSVQKSPVLLTNYNNKYTHSDQ